VGVMLIVGGLVDGAMLTKNVRGKENDHSHPIPSLPHLTFSEEPNPTIFCIVSWCRPWQEMAKKSFHRNPKTWFDWLLTYSKMFMLSILSVRNWAQTVRSTWQGECLRTRTSDLLT
jgi:hypothetical protein